MVSDDWWGGREWSEEAPKSAKKSVSSSNYKSHNKRDNLQINKYNKKMFKLFLIIKLFTFIYTRELYM